LPLKAHREREDYFLRSPVARQEPADRRGGLMECSRSAARKRSIPRSPRTTRADSLAQLCASSTPRQRDSQQSEIELVLSSAAPPAAQRRLWRIDREFFCGADGIHLNAAAAYESADLKVSAAMDDITSRRFRESAERVVRRTAAANTGSASGFRLRRCTMERFMASLANPA